MRPQEPAWASTATSQILHFPPELWGRLARWLHPREFLRLCSSSPHLLAQRERSGLWRHFCHAEGYARQADGTNSKGDTFAELWWTGPEVDWQRSFQLNAHAEACAQRHVFACVRVRDEELRVPAEVDEGEEGKSSPTRAWLHDHGWRSRTTLSRALRRMLEPCHVPMRFRELIAGRPGMPIRRARFFQGGGPASALAEWPIGREPAGAWKWRLPPHSFEEGAALDAQESEDAGVYPRPHPWGRGNGWLVEMYAEVPATRPVSRWVHVGQHQPAGRLTLRELCEELEQFLPAMGFLKGLPLVPANARHHIAEASPQTFLLSELRWTQGERLVLWEGALPPGSSWGNEGEDSAEVRPKALGRKAILFVRDAVRPLIGPPARSQDRGCLLPARPTSTSSGGTSQQPPSQEHTDSQPLHAPQSEASAWRSLSARAWCRKPWDFEDGDQATGQSILEEMPEAPLDTAVPHVRKLILSSSGVRQFEFHPTRRNTMLAGRKDGVIAVLDHEADITTHLLEIDSYPILGLSWLHTQPQWAVVGASQSGTTCLVRYDESRPGWMEHVRLEPFCHLSSLSVNCTDEFFMTSGFCVDLGLYDITTGRRLRTFRGLHQNFINILRFAHRSPHIFATASFDHTCKVWDLREPISASWPVRCFKTDTLNVMCCFSPDDQHILCSGVDNALQQFSVLGNGRANGSHFPLPRQHSDTNYRRSLYLADGSLVATASTNESLLRIYSASQPHRQYGQIDFRGMLSRRRQYVQQPDEGQLRARLGGSVVASMSTAALPNRAEDQRPPEEYVQSLRCHPADPLLMGVLLSSSDPQPESYIAMMRLGSDSPHAPLQ